jgi:hypothetical protein
LKSEPPARSGGVTIDLNDAAVVVGCSNDTWIHWKKAEIDVPKVSTASHDPGLFRICVSASTVRGKGSTPIPLRTMFEPSTVWQKEKKEKKSNKHKKETKLDQCRSPVTCNHWRDGKPNRKVAKGHVQ